MSRPAGQAQPRWPVGNMIKTNDIKAIASSLAAYLIVSILVAGRMFRCKIGDIELLVPGAIVLLSTIVAWFRSKDRYAFARCKYASTIFFVVGLLGIVFVSFLYPVLRMGAFWEEPGDIGGAWLAIIMGISLISQLAGFMIGFIPAAVFIRHTAHAEEPSR